MTNTKKNVVTKTKTEAKARAKKKARRTQMKRSNTWKSRCRDYRAAGPGKRYSIRIGYGEDRPYEEKVCHFRTRRELDAFIKGILDAIMDWGNRDDLVITTPREFRAYRFAVTEAAGHGDWTRLDPKNGEPVDHFTGEPLEEEAVQAT